MKGSQKMAAFLSSGMDEPRWSQMFTRLNFPRKNRCKFMLWGFM